MSNKLRNKSAKRVPITPNDWAKSLDGKVTFYREKIIYFAGAIKGYQIQQEGLEEMRISAEDALNKLLDECLKATGIQLDIDKIKSI